MTGGGLAWLLCSAKGFLRKPKKTRQKNVWGETRGRRTGTGGQLLPGITCAKYYKIRENKITVGGRNEGGREGSHHRERYYHTVLLLYGNQQRLFAMLTQALTTLLVLEFS